MTKIYKNSVSQQEIDSLLDFYRKDDGRVTKLAHKDYKMKCAVPADADFPKVLYDIIGRFIDYEYEIDDEIIIMESGDYNSRLHVDNSPDKESWGAVILIPLYVPDSGAETIFFNNHYLEKIQHTTTIFSKCLYPNGGAMRNTAGKAIWFDDVSVLLPLIDEDGEITVAGNEFYIDERFRGRISVLANAEKGGTWRKAVTDYSKLTGYDPNAVIDQEIVSRYLSHFHPSDLQGLSVDQIVHWKLGDAYVFERSVLHCGSSNSLGKIGLTIFINKNISVV